MKLKVHIQEMLDVGAIQPSNSPYASAVILVYKKWEIMILYQPAEIKCQDNQRCL